MPGTAGAAGTAGGRAYGLGGLVRGEGGGAAPPGAPLVSNAVALSGDGSTLFVGGYTLASGFANWETWVYTDPPGPAPSIGTGQVVNAASLLPGIAPASWVTALMLVAWARVG